VVDHEREFGLSVGAKALTTASAAPRKIIERKDSMVRGAKNILLC
jgi:hypothetical protein